MTQTVLQRVDLDPPLEVSGLYYGEVVDIAASEPVQFRNGALSIPAGRSVTFDSYFSAFFENYWFGYTSLRSLSLEVEVDGDAVVTLRRQTPDTDRYVLGRRHVVGGGRAEFRIEHDDELRVEAGRIWFEIESLSEVTVRSARWVTDEPPRRHVSLGVVFCTFNRQKYLQRILRAMDDDPYSIEAVSRVFVINQGDSFTADEIVGPDCGGGVLAKLTIIEQANLGGCGGFTRGMYETLGDEDLTHFLLMDDDSRVNPESIARAARFMAYCDDTVVLGGHMLNLHRPQRLFEAGAMFDDASLQPRPVHHNIDLVAEGGTEPFLRAGAVSYNGWWMFGAPSSLIEKIGYPMPSFIRGDDMEFGLRVQNAGLQTIPVPGIAVWHEPFYLKLGGWQFYFEVRNRLAMAALHHHQNFRAIRKDFTRTFARDIAMCRYHSCKLMLDGIRSYSQGPAVALDTTDGPLHAARATVAKYGPKQVDVVAHVSGRVEDLRTRGELRRMLDNVQRAVGDRTGKVKLAGQVLRRLAVSEGPALGNEPVARASELKPHVAAGHDRYVVIEEYGGTAWRFDRNRAIERSLWREFAALIGSVEHDPRYAESLESTDSYSAVWSDIFGRERAEQR